MAITLPTSKIAATTQDPRNLIIFGAPKVGKTTIVSTLENCLIFDLEEGTKYIDALKLDIKTVNDFIDACRAIKAANKPYKYIAIDNITRLAELAKPLALKDFLETQQGKNFTGTDVLTAAHGAGYAALWKAIKKLIDLVSQVTENVILIGHVKSGAEDGDILKDLNMPGEKSKIELTSLSDAIGYVYRDEDSNLCINFESDAVCAGARPQHLANQNIIVAERQPDGTFTSHWDRIYPSETV